MIFKLKYEPYEGFATITDGFLPHEIDNIRNMIEGKTKGTIGGEGVVDAKTRDSFIKWISPNKDTQWIFDKIAILVNTFNPQYFNVDLTHFEDLQLTEYDSKYQGFYGQHTDSSYGGPFGNRKLSLTMQLSDPTDYEGGDLKLYHTNFTNPAIGNRSKGAITLFRSHIIHEVTPVTKGIRYSLVTWIHGPLYK